MDLKNMVVFEVSHFPRFTLELKLSFNELKIINKSFKNLLFVKEHLFLFNNKVVLYIYRKYGI